MLKFICGVLVGGIIGVVMMCLLQINKIQQTTRKEIQDEVSVKDKKKAEKRYQEYLKKMNKKKGELKK